MYDLLRTRQNGEERGRGKPARRLGLIEMYHADIFFVARLYAYNRGCAATDGGAAQSYSFRFRNQVEPLASQARGRYREFLHHRPKRARE